MRLKFPSGLRYYTKIDELNDTKKALEKIDAKIAGVVFNRANQTKRGKYSNYYE